jgi:N6-L-threonylcarbamoyladenine synthase
MTCASASEQLILGIETSCDETAAAIVTDGRRVLSSFIASQEQIHALFGGVVPEIASRQHTELLVNVTERALQQAGVMWCDLRGIAVTNGPGLIGSLLVGVSTAKAYHAATGLPLVGVNHLQAHIAANFADLCKLPLHTTDLPAVCLVVSGGHTDLLLLEHPTEYKLLGMTRDDAAGEAFDKAARVLQLGYPGGPAVSKAAENGDPAAFAFPRPRVADTLDFSFSGLKTALIRRVQQLSPGAQDQSLAEHLDELIVADLAASFQAAVIDTLVRNCMEAARQTRVDRLAICGGVAANRMLRQELTQQCRDAGLIFHCPPPELCTDNAVMVAIAGYHILRMRKPDNLKLDVFSAMPR